MASNNDSGVRDFDMERFQLSKHFCFPWPVNVSTSTLIFHVLNNRYDIFIIIVLMGIYIYILLYLGLEFWQIMNWHDFVEKKRGSVVVMTLLVCTTLLIIRIQENGKKDRMVKTELCFINGKCLITIWFELCLSWYIFSLYSFPFLLLCKVLV